MNKSFVLIVLLSLLAVAWYVAKPNTGKGLDDFAKCLKSKNIVMYGADWCPHCQNEKNAFGDSFQFIQYVECPKNPNRCLAAGINSYPTWIFPASPAGGPDGRKLQGEQGLEKLSQESGCPLGK